MTTGIVTAVMMAAAMGGAQAAAGGLAPLRQGTWRSGATAGEVATALYVPAAPGGGRAGAPVVFYLKGLAGPRVGTEPDEAILADLLGEGFVVLTMDYGGNAKATAPFINADFRGLRREVEAQRGKAGLLQGQRVDFGHMYFLPAGYRLLRDVVYFGEGRDAYRLDIRYPSKPARPVPAVLQIPVSNGNRMDNSYGHWMYNEEMAEGFLTRGYAAVQVDNPVKVYKGVDPMPEVAIRLKAAVRTVRANAARCHIDAAHVGVMGFSRGSGQAGLLAMTAGRKELEQGPHLEQSSTVQAAILHAGRMDHLLLDKTDPREAEKYRSAFGDPAANRAVWDAHSAISYVGPASPPTFLSVGGADSYRVAQLAAMADALKKAGVDYRHAVTPGMGHQVTADLTILGDMYDFFDKHLKCSGAPTRPARP